MRDLVNNITPNAPCKDCVAPKRHFGCHSECDEYKEYKKKTEEAKLKVQKEKDFERTFYAKKRDVCTKVLKSKKGK